MKKKCLLIKEQDGAVIVLVALLMVVLLSISALVVDVGALYLEKSRVQKAVDAAVLAGVQVLPATERAKEIAIAVADKNGVVIIDNNNNEDVVKNIVVTPTSIEVITETEIDLTFARIMGFSTANIAARARAEKSGTITGGSGFLPIIIEKGAFILGQESPLTLQPSTSDTGNFGYISFEDGTLALNITNGYQGYLSVGSVLTTKPGNNTSSNAVREAINNRIALDENKLHCQSPSTADNSCNKLIYIPMVNHLKTVSGASPITIVGFAALLLTNNGIHPSTNNVITGHFIESIYPGDVGTGTESFGLSSVKLVN